MQQELFHLPKWLPWIGGNPIYGYGVMMVLGFFAALQLARFLARRSQIDPEVFVNAGLIALLAGVIGARLSHVLETLPQYTNPDRTAWENLWDAINIRSGGLTFYGGFLLATPCVIAYGMYKKVPIRRGMDIVAPCLMVGLAFGRIGCFLNGCCYGAECKIEWLGVRFPYHSNAYIDEVKAGELKAPLELRRVLTDGTRGTALMSVDEIKASDKLSPEEKTALLATAAGEHSLELHPSQLYSTLTAFLIAALLVAYYTVPHPPGRVFALMLLIEAPSRFILEMIRAEPPVIGRGSGVLSWLPPLSFSMVLSVGLFLAGIVLWRAFRGPNDDLGFTDAERPAASGSLPGKPATV
jgi:phosphatidylglycerol:prolipoprotein diacylglycerol transferase